MRLHPTPSACACPPPLSPPLSPPWPCLQEPPLHPTPTGCRAGNLVNLVTSGNQSIPVKLKVSQVEDSKGNTLHVMEVGACLRALGGGQAAPCGVGGWVRAFGGGRLHHMGWVVEVGAHVRACFGERAG